MTQADILSLSEAVLTRAAARSSGALSASRLRQILRGASPKGDERFVFRAVLVSALIGERRQLAAAAGLSWYKFASRFQSLTGIHRDRAGSATALYSRAG